MSSLLLQSVRYRNTGTLEHHSHSSHFFNGIYISLSTCVLIRSRAKLVSCVELVAYFDTAEGVQLVTCAIGHSSLNLRYMVVSMVAPVLVN